MASIRRHPRGNALVVALVVVIVLTLIGIAALRMAGDEAASVSRRIDAQVLQVCADAAAKKLWAEFALYGSSAVTVQPTVVPGTDLRVSIDHYDSDPKDPVTNVITGVTFDEDSMRPVDMRWTSAGIENVDNSNTFRTAGLGGQPFVIVAHCTDRNEHQYEVELLVKFGI